MWELVIYAGITWAGAGKVSINNMPDKETCIEVLKEIKTDSGVASKSSVESGGSYIVFCRPANKDNF